MKVSQLIKMLQPLQQDTEVFFMSCCDCDIGIQSPTTVELQKLDDYNAYLIDLEA